VAGEVAMRGVFVVISLVFAGAVAPVAAYENFIPMGTGYSTEVSEVPTFDSERGQVIQETDLIESEQYRRKREAQAFDSYVNRFTNSQELSGGDTFIDY
jgi:hypothetical protein